MAHDEPLPRLEFDGSAYTGWTRAHWEAWLARLTCGYVLAAERYGSPARALHPDDRLALPASVDGLESIARLASAWGAWLNNPSNPAALHDQGRELNLETLLRQALLDGTNPYTTGARLRQNDRGRTRPGDELTCPGGRQGHSTTGCCSRPWRVFNRWASVSSTRR